MTCLDFDLAVINTVVYRWRYKSILRQGVVGCRLQI
jgi:hypothetical protein